MHVPPWPWNGPNILIAVCIWWSIYVIYAHQEFMFIRIQLSENAWCNIHKLYVHVYPDVAMWRLHCVHLTVKGAGFAIQVKNTAPKMTRSPEFHAKICKYMGAVKLPRITMWWSTSWGSKNLIRWITTTPDVSWLRCFKISTSQTIS